MAKNTKFTSNLTEWGDIYSDDKYVSEVCAFHIILQNFYLHPSRIVEMFSLSYWRCLLLTESNTPVLCAVGWGRTDNSYNISFQSDSIKQPSFSRKTALHLYLSLQTATYPPCSSSSLIFHCKVWVLRRPQLHRFRQLTLLRTFPGWDW